MLLAAAGLGGLVSLVLSGQSLSDVLLGTPMVATRTTLVAQRAFPICAGGTRVTCVVDGDTFWLDGIKVRIADIDTPEVSEPSCAGEAALGARATNRLAELLVAGPFDMRTADRDEDRYGRKLRLVYRDGESLGAMLVRDGLARTWDGARHSWC
ncbi:MAG: thermonuclease family protein [Alphaproteobacteria bacterium]|nr:thermonuclease family protein [Alphaproteobacteria bacterium]